MTQESKKSEKKAQSLFQDLQAVFQMKKSNMSGAIYVIYILFATNLHPACPSHLLNTLLFYFIYRVNTHHCMRKRSNWR